MLILVARIIQLLLIGIPIAFFFVKGVNPNSLILTTLVCFGIAVIISLLISISRKLDGDKTN